MKSSRMRSLCSRFGGAFASALFATACVTGYHVRKTPEDAASGPYGTAQNRAADPEPAAVVERVPREARPGFVWVRGYYHWDGVKYVWVPGRWEAEKTPYRWSTLSPAK
jgi:hypothetical protein